MSSESQQLPFLDMDMKQPMQMKPKGSPTTKELGQGIYEVPSESTAGVTYQVDTVQKTCTCPQFVNKQVECKHLRKIMGNTTKSTDWEGRTKNGYKSDEVVSALQKEIRRGNELMAVWWARELVETGWWKYLFRRLQVIAGEDIGHANPAAMHLVNSTYTALMTQAQDAKKSWWKPDNNVYQFVVGYMARSQKSRHVDYLGGIIYKKAEAGWHPEIPDYAVDEHTKRGREMGRNDDDFFREGSRIANKKHIEGEDEVKKECLELYGFTEGRDENEF